MASIKAMPQIDEKVTKLLQCGTGYRSMDDPFFEANNTVIFKPFVRLGVYRYDDESFCHKSNRVRCNIPNCNQEFDTLFAYENHYNSLHRFLCAQCSKNLPSAHLLDLHLSEKHDSFFAVQSERKPMFRCYLEECPKLSQTPTERRDHCISEHKFPHDFRFDCYNHTKKNATNKVDGKSNNAKAKKHPEQVSVLKPSKLVSVTTHDEDIELEDKSILLTAQRKHFSNFSFGHKKTKTFRSNVSSLQAGQSSSSSSSGGNSSYAKQLTSKSEIKHTKSQSGLDDINMVDELIDSLPK